MKNNILFPVILFFVFLSFNSVYSQTEKMRFSMKYSITRNSFEFLNDFSKHKMGVASGSGVIFDKDGITSNVNAGFVYDYINGSGNFIGNYLITFIDSSRIFIKAEGNSYGDENNPLFAADLKITGGTGIYLKIKGIGKMTGDRKKLIEENSVVNLNFEIEYVLE